MPLLAGYLGTLLFGIASWLGAFLTKRIAIVVAVIVFVTGITVAFIAAMQAAITALSYAIPSEIMTGVSWIWPDNANACIAAMISTKIAIWVYEWNIKIIQYKLI